MGGGNGRKALSAQDILGVDDRPLVPLDVPEWGGTIYLRAMSARQVAAFTEKAEAASEKNAMAMAVVLCAVDENGSPLFTDDHVEVLRDRSFAALKRVSDVAMNLNGLNAKEAETAKNASGEVARVASPIALPSS